MSFLDVDQEKRHAFLVSTIEIVQRGNLPAEWRSWIAAQNQNDGLFASKVRKLNSRFLIKSFQRKAWRFVSRFQAARSRAQPQRLEWNDREGNFGCFRHHPGEDFGPLAHHREQAAKQDNIYKR